MSKFFIDRPIVAIVTSILTVIIGMCLPLGAAHRPVPEDRAPGGAHHDDVRRGRRPDRRAVGRPPPIEQQMSGVDNLNYMYSINASDGSLRLTTDFDVATDPNTDLILSQMRVTQATPQLPADVATYGVIRPEAADGAAHDPFAVFTARDLTTARSSRTTRISTSTTS